MRRFLGWIEVALSGVLIVMVALAVVGLAAELLRPAHFLSADGVAAVIDHVLEVLVLLELLATALAYLERHDVIRRILEAALLAVARKLIAIDLGSAPLAKAGAIAVLLVALGAAWMMFVGRRRGPPARPEKQAISVEK